MQKASYGIDAPTVLRTLAIGAIACSLLSIFVLRAFIGPAVGFTFAALMLVWSSLFGKYRARDSLLNALILTDMAAQIVALNAEELARDQVEKFDRTFFA